jgi:hemoglobin-like flavoprotein
MTEDSAPVRTSEDQRLLRDILELLAPIVDELIATFYDRLFVRYPHLRPMFPVTLDVQRERFLRAIMALVRHYDHPQALLPAFAAMGRRHERYGVGIQDYAAMGAVFIGTLRDFAGPVWTPAHHGAWVRAYTFAAGSMQAGALADDEEEPLVAA